MQGALVQHGLIRLRQERHHLLLLFPRARSVLDAKVTDNEALALQPLASPVGLAHDQVLNP